MPFKIVSYIENGEVFVNAVPSNWEKENMLYWPPTNNLVIEGRLRKDENSIPDETTWSIRPCKVKLVDIESLKDALGLEKKYALLTDSESEERWVKILIFYFEF